MIQNSESRAKRIFGTSETKKTTTRTCLRCGREFESEGIFNRICQYCIHTKSWTDGWS